MLNASSILQVSRIVQTTAVSPKYDFAFMRPVGKVAGTELHNGYLEPAMCNLLFPRKIDKHAELLFAGHGAGQHPIAVAAGCGEFLAREDYLRPSRSVADFATRSLVFAAVRDPYARAVSIYKYICEERGSHAGFISFARMLAGAGGPALQLDHYYGSTVAESHWMPQAPYILTACRFARVLAIRTEPNVIDGLDAIVARINEQLGASDHAAVSSSSTTSRSRPPPLPTPSKFTRRSGNNKTAAMHANANDYAACPWQCYFELCGEICMSAMLDHYPLDVFHLGYPVPANTDALWSTDRVFPADRAALAIASAENRTSSCLQACPLLWHGARAQKPPSPGTTVVRSPRDQTVK